MRSCRLTDVPSHVPVSGHKTGGSLSRLSLRGTGLRSVSEGILNLLNHEICCDFTHMIVTEGIDIDSNKTPLCGAI